MLFFSVFWLKSIISIGIVLTLLLGIALLYILVYAFLISSVTAQILPDFRNGFIATFMTTSVLMIFSSLSGIFGLIRKRNKMVICYSITMLIYFIAFVILGAFMIKYPEVLKSECEDPDQKVSQIRQAVAIANETLGKSCQCYFYMESAYNSEQRTILQNMGFQNYSNDNTLPINAENCEYWDNASFPATSSLIFLQTVFNCSGWCKVEENFNLYYLFTDVNRGIPKETCIVSLLQFFDQFGTIMEISSFSASGVLFLILLAILCLCCHPDRTQEYDAMKFFKSTLMVELNEEK